jgi:hypothetical protein
MTPRYTSNPGKRAPNILQPKQEITREDSPWFAAEETETDIMSDRAVEDVAPATEPATERSAAHTPPRNQTQALAAAAGHYCF